MAETDELIARLKEACVGHPHSKIPWPHRLLHDSIAEIERLRAIEALALEALRPFVNVRDQFPETIKLIQKKLDGLTPISVTVTKAQFLEAVDLISERLPASKGEDAQ